MAIKVRRGKLYPPIEMQEGLALGLDEMEWEKIVDRLGRPPNYFEASIFASLWSEDVSNKSSTSLLETIAREQPEVIEIPGSQISLVRIDETHFLTLRVVNNNAQSYLEPYYGAQTAISFALEELASVGASPLALLNLFRFGNHDQIQNQILFQGVVSGVGAYGCKYGIPVVGGELYFHEKYNNAVITNSAIAGIVTNDKAMEPPDVAFHSPVLYVGAVTGKDGLAEKQQDGDQLSEDRYRIKRTLKMSDPLLANRLISACSEAIEAGVLKEVISVGTGGLAVACFNLARRINKPILLDIDRIPLRVSELEPLDIILSESSQRLLMVVDKGKHRALNNVLHKWDLESLKVGEVNDADGIEFYWNHYLAADIPFQFALGGSVQKSFDVVKFPPMLKRSAKVEDDADKARKRKRKVEDEWSLVREVSLAKQEEEKDKEIICPPNLEDVWLDMLADPNLCSRAPVYRMFDQVIGANTIQRPGGDAAVLRVRSFSNGEMEINLDEKEEPTEDSNETKADAPAGHATRAIALTLDSNSLYVSMEPYLGTVQTMAEGMRNLAATGARPVGLAYCMNYGDPDRYEDVCDLSESIRGLGDASEIWHIPILSKQICLYNGTEGHPAMPTPTILMAGIVRDLSKCCSIGFKSKGDIILLIGRTENEIGCSEYSNYAHKFVNRLVPDINFEDEKKSCELVVQLIEKSLINSAHDISAGGMAIALTECCMMRERPLGATFHIDPQTFDSPNGPIPLRKDSALFSETSARFLISCSAENEKAVREMCEASEIPITGTGTVGGKDVKIEGAAKVELPLSTTYKLWIHRLEILLGQGGKETMGF